MVSVIDAARNRERKRDDREKEKKAQREAKEREITVRMNAIDCIAMSPSLPAAQDDRCQRGMFLGTPFSGGDAVQRSLSSS
jgi:hypothetical protein